MCRTVYNRTLDTLLLLECRTRCLPPVIRVLFKFPSSLKSELLEEKAKNYRLFFADAPAGCRRLTSNDTNWSGHEGWRIVQNALSLEADFSTTTRFTRLQKALHIYWTTSVSWYWCSSIWLTTDLRNAVWSVESGEKHASASQ